MGCRGPLRGRGSIVHVLDPLIHTLDLWEPGDAGLSLFPG